MHALNAINGENVKHRPFHLSYNLLHSNFFLFSVAVCPHAVIRPFIVTRDEADNAPNPDTFVTVKALGNDLAGKRYTLQISPLDCTGCNACVQACPEAPKALEMHDVEDVLSSGGEENWNYAVNLPERGDLVDKYTLKGSQFQLPLMEFSGACSGCGETPYCKTCDKFVSFVL